MNGSLHQPVYQHFFAPRAQSLQPCQCRIETIHPAVGMCSGKCVRRDRFCLDGGQSPLQCRRRLFMVLIRLCGKAREYRRGGLLRFAMPEIQ